MIVNKTEEIIEELFQSLLQKYQEGFKKVKFVFNSVDLLNYNLHKKI